MSERKNPLKRTRSSAALTDHNSCVFCQTDKEESLSACLPENSVIGRTIAERNLELKCKLADLMARGDGCYILYHPSCKLQHYTSTKRKEENSDMNESGNDCVIVREIAETGFIESVFEKMTTRIPSHRRELKKFSLNAFKYMTWTYQVTSAREPTL